MTYSYPKPIFGPREIIRAADFDSLLRRTLMSYKDEASITQAGEPKSAWKLAQESYEAERLKLIGKGKRGQWNFGRIHSERLRAEVATYVTQSAWLMAQPEFKKFLGRGDGEKFTRQAANANRRPTNPANTNGKPKGQRKKR
jgi:hypothetical protein